MLQVLALRALERNCIITVAGQDIPNLKAGALRDFEERILPNWDAVRAQIKAYNKTDRKFTFKNGSVLEFKSYKDRQDAKSGKRDFLFINEAQGVPYEVAFELIARTTTQVFVDYNPNAEFWVHDELLPREDAVRFISNYTHNPFISEQVRKEIERLKSDPMMWRVYGLGYTGKISGTIFPNVSVGDPETWPTILDREGYGLDFGFTNDPTALVKLGLSDGQIYGEQLIYETGLTAEDLVQKFERIGIKAHDRIFADAADPLMIETLRRKQYNVRAAKKGADSIRTGIDLLKQYPIILHPNSRDWRDEAKKYIWNPKDPTRPVDFANHAWDAARYWAIERLLKRRTVVY